MKIFVDRQSVQRMTYTASLWNEPRGACFADVHHLALVIVAIPGAPSWNVVLAELAGKIVEAEITMDDGTDRYVRPKFRGQPHAKAIFREVLDTFFLGWQLYDKSVKRPFDLTLSEWLDQAERGKPKQKKPLDI